MVYPQSWIGFVKRNDFDQRTRRVTALNVEGSSRSSKSENQATWSIFVIGIIFDHFAHSYGFSNLSDSDVSEDALVSRML
jgi:hypothetical protein